MKWSVDAESFNKIVQMHLVYTLLVGLGDVFDKIRSDVLLTDPHPSVKQTFTYVWREAMRHYVMMGTTTVAVIVVCNSSSQSTSSGRRLYTLWWSEIWSGSLLKLRGYRLVESFKALNNMKMKLQQAGTSFSYDYDVPTIFGRSLR